MSAQRQESTDWREGRRLRAWELHQQGWKQTAIAPTRGGKGLLATSQLLSWQHSVIVNDIKGELFQQTAGYRSTVIETADQNCQSPQSTGERVVLKLGRTEQGKHTGKPGRYRIVRLTTGQTMF